MQLGSVPQSSVSQNALVDDDGDESGSLGDDPEDSYAEKTGRLAEMIADMPGSAAAQKNHSEIPKIPEEVKKHKRK